MEERARRGPGPALWVPGLQPACACRVHCPWWPMGPRGLQGGENLCGAPPPPPVAGPGGLHRPGQKLPEEPRDSCGSSTP